MIDNDGFIEVVLKDFNQPAPNGWLYDTDHPTTQQAIEKLCSKDHIFGELGHPRLEGYRTMEEKIARTMQVHIDRVTVGIRDMRYNADTKILTGRVKNSGDIFPDLASALEKNAVRFGMRAFVRPLTGPDKKAELVNIVTFDLINGP